MIHISCLPKYRNCNPHYMTKIQVRFWYYNPLQTHILSWMECESRQKMWNVVPFGVIFPTNNFLCCAGKHLCRVLLLMDIDSHQSWQNLESFYPSCLTEKIIYVDLFQRPTLLHSAVQSCQKNPAQQQITFTKRISPQKCLLSVMTAVWHFLFIYF